MFTNLWTDGTRVIINPHAFWPAGGTGTVRPFPAIAIELVGGSSGCLRTFTGAKRTLTMVWVVFDSPLHDGDGDGPYREGEIDDLHLTPITAELAHSPRQSTQ
jgi:hypothetical protein